MCFNLASFLIFFPFIILSSDLSFLSFLIFLSYFGCLSPCSLLLFLLRFLSLCYLFSKSSAVILFLSDVILLAVSYFCFPLFLLSLNLVGLVFFISPSLSYIFKSFHFIVYILSFPELCFATTCFLIVYPTSFFPSLFSSFESAAPFSPVLFCP